MSSTSVSTTRNVVKRKGRSFILMSVDKDAIETVCMAFKYGFVPTERFSMDSLASRIKVKIAGIIREELMKTNRYTTDNLLIVEGSRDVTRPGIPSSINGEIHLKLARVSERIEENYQDAIFMYDRVTTIMEDELRDIAELQ